MNSLPLVPRYSYAEIENLRRIAKRDYANAFHWQDWHGMASAQKRINECDRLLSKYRKETA